MGVTGLWRLIEPAGKPVPVETLENKVLAVDISIWLHQMVKGYQDAKGAPLPNAHLMGLFQRLCKLLYFRIKPVFVFDGAFPDLKRETIAKRQDNKSKYNSESERLKRELALLLSKKTAISSLLGKQISPKKVSNSSGPADNDDLFKLPAIPQNNEESESETDEESSSSSIVDLHSVDIESSNFKNLPVKEKYDLLIELKETRKMNSWGKLHELPKKSDNFSDFQMQRLLKRRKVQECLEETEKEMGDSGMSLNELESLLNEEGIDTKIDNIPTRRIASNNTTRFLLINNVKQALADAKKKEDENKAEIHKAEEDKLDKGDIKLSITDELEEDLQKAIKMSLECGNEANTSACTSKTDDSWTSCMTESDYSNTDSEEEDGFEEPDISSAKAYIMQYSDLTNKAIENIVASRTKSSKNKTKVPRVNEILEEINKEKSVVIDKVDLSSGDEDCTQESTDNTDSKIIEGQNHSVVELNTTQPSVVCIDNSIQDIVTLDSSSEESTNKTEQELPSVDNKQYSDSSDSEFEDVPDLEMKSDKTVVQLILNMDAVTGDDIFADVFDDKKQKTDIVNKSIGSQKQNTESKFNDINIERNEDRIKIGLIKPTNEDDPDSDNELQKAIMMSMECVSEEDTNACLINIENVISGKGSRSKEKFIANVEKLNKEPASVNDTQTQSLSKIQIEPLSQKTNIENENNKKTFRNDSDSPPKESICVDEQISQKTNIENKKNKKIVADDIDNQPKEPISIDNQISQKANIETENNKKIVSNDSDSPPKDPISLDKLNNMVEEIQNEEQELLQEKGRFDRVGRNITEQMTKEAQELLQLFGIPYIVAPMEAEAQCAFLESVNLTDGTITDDSDIWLFGGKTVYKNFFNQKKHVLQFLADRIEKSFNLNREQLILLALLVGSDYTTGVTGVGPVTALEILASFPFNKKFLIEASKKDSYGQIVTGLQEFKQWVRSGRRTDNIRLKNKLKNVNLTDDFPNIRVVQAYLEPNVEKSEDKFTWGELDITILRDYTKAKFGWSQHKLDEIINPVLKRMLERKKQRSVQDYFKRKVEFENLEDQMSKRVKAAVLRIGSDTLPVEEQSAPIKDKLKPQRKRKVNKNKNDTIKTNTVDKAGPSGAKQQKISEENVLIDHHVRVINEVEDAASNMEIRIPKSDRFQEVIPQREKDKQSLLQNKMKAIELFRKTKIDRKKKITKRKPIQPKDKAELSESSDSN